MASKTPNGCDRPRASALISTVHCMPSAVLGTAGRRLLRVPMPTTWASATAGSIRRTAATVRSVFSCVASRNRAPGDRVNDSGLLRYVGARGFSWSSSITDLDTYANRLYFNTDWIKPQDYGNRAFGFQLRCLQEAGAARHAKAGVFSTGRVIKRPVARPRASALISTVRCITSATAGTVGRRRCPAPMSASWTSAPPGSGRRVAAAVRTVFSCVASRKRVMLGTRTRRPRGSDAPSGPNPLGKNQSLSSPPLEPRGLLLSVMRQKVGKERSQEGCAPLANPHRFLACPLRKFGPSPTP